MRRCRPPAADRTVVFDAEDAGWAAAAQRRADLDQRKARMKCSPAGTAQRAHDIIKDGQRSLAWIGEFIRTEGIDCDFGVVGRLHAAQERPSSYGNLVRRSCRAAQGPRSGDRDRRAFGAARGNWAPTPIRGGVIYRQHAWVDPARYHHGLLESAVQRAGARIVGSALPGHGHREDGDRTFRVGHAARRHVHARNVVVATNGYTGPLTPWLQRRVIPISSYMIATEPLSAAQMARLMPKNRIVSDTRKVVFYYRASPDQRRILFGGRVSTDETDPADQRPQAARRHGQALSELAGVRSSATRGAASSRIRSTN